MAEDNSTGGGEYEREPVPESALMGPSKFWGMYAGEHAAGTEFMIGPLFLGAGASLQDLILGLLLGNILAIFTISSSMGGYLKLTIYPLSFSKIYEIRS